jgi:hypothetical protein
MSDILRVSWKPSYIHSPVLQTIPTCSQSLLLCPLLPYLHVIVLYTLHFQPHSPSFVEAPATALDKSHPDTLHCPTDIVSQLDLSLVGNSDVSNKFGAICNQWQAGKLKGNDFRDSDGTVILELCLKMAFFLPGVVCSFSILLNVEL